MASDLETKAKEAFIDDHLELAVDLYSKAIAELFADRAQASIKLKKFSEAVCDANSAIELDSLLAKAYFRKGFACIKLGDYQTAKSALEIGSSLAPRDSRFANLINECDERIADEASDLAKPTLKKKRENDASSQTIELPKEHPNDEEKIAKSTKPKFRHEFYQKPEEIVVTIFAKKIPHNNVTVDYGDQILSVTIDVPGEDAYHFQPRLFGKIIPSKCRYDVLSTKIEIRLAKVEPMQWTSLEFSKEVAVVLAPMVDASSVTAIERLTYPSSNPKAVDWDKLEAEVKKEEKDEKLDGDAGLNKLFRDIYKDGDEDARRAMQKSFVESNGTVLSTNWKDVGSKKIKGSPPDGMEVKKWEI